MEPRAEGLQKFFGPSQEAVYIRPPTFHWPEPNHIITPNCKGDWENPSSYEPRKRNSATDARLHTGRGHQSGSVSLRSSLTPVPCTEKPLKMQSSLVQPRAEKHLPSLPLWFCWFVIYRHSSPSTLFSPKYAGWRPRE